MQSTENLVSKLRSSAKDQRSNAIITTQYFLKTKEKTQSTHLMSIAIFDKLLRAVTIGAIVIDQKVD